MSLGVKDNVNNLWKFVLMYVPIFKLSTSATLTPHKIYTGARARSRSSQLSLRFGEADS